MSDSYNPEVDYADRIQRYRLLTPDELIGVFNSDVGKVGWVAARGVFHAAVVDALTEKGVDISVIQTESGYSWLFPVKLMEDGSLSLDILSADEL